MPKSAFVAVVLVCTAGCVSAAAEIPDLSGGITAYQQNDYAKAAAEFSALEAKYPNDARIDYYLGSIALKQHRFDEAVQRLEHATQLDPKNSSYFAALGDAYGSLANQSYSFTDAQKSCAALEHAVELDARNVEARVALITFYRKAPSMVGGSLAKAYEQAKALRAINEPVGARLLATLYENEKRYDEGIAVCLESLKKFPEDYGLQFVTGRIAVGAGAHFDEGIAALNKCLTLNPTPGIPGHAVVQVRLAQLYFKKGDSAESRKHFEAALQLDPNNKDAKDGLALVSPH